MYNIASRMHVSSDSSSSLHKEIEWPWSPLYSTGNDAKNALNCEIVSHIGWLDAQRNVFLVSTTATTGRARRVTRFCC